MKIIAIIIAIIFTTAFVTGLIAWGFHIYSFTVWKNTESDVS